jgi:hypothetical protein
MKLASFAIRPDKPVVMDVLWLSLADAGSKPDRAINVKDTLSRIFYALVERPM